MGPGDPMNRAKAPTIWAGTLLSTLVLGLGAAVAASPDAPSFDQVLATPDNTKVDVDYARAQANAGNLLEAAAALERVLIVHGGLSDVRLFYAAVLYRLDDLQEAAEQLQLLDDHALSPLQKAEADKYRSLVRRRGTAGKAAGKFGGSLSVGVSYDSDAFGALNTQFDFAGGQVKQHGSADTFSGELHGAVPLGQGDDLSLFGAVAGYDREQLSGGDDRLKSLEGRLGLAHEGPVQSWSIGAVARTYSIFSSHYLDEYGALATASWRTSPSTTLSLSAEAVDQTFHDPLIDFYVAHAGLPGNRDGGRYGVNLSVSHRFSAKSTVSVGIGYAYKTAGYKPFGYSAPGVRGRWDVLLGRGAYLSASGDARFFSYRGVDKFFLGAKRSDTRSTANVALGAPFSAFTTYGATGDFRENLVIEGALRYSRRDDKTPIADYDDWGADLRLIWRFGSSD